MNALFKGLNKTAYNISVTTKLEFKYQYGSVRLNKNSCRLIEARNPTNKGLRWV